MGTPATELDSRFSEPGAAATSWEDTRRALAAAEMFWITTVRPGGRPHMTPLVAVWLDGALHFSTGAGEQKAANLRANPHVILTTGSSTWDGGLDVMVEGDAVRVTGQAMLEQLARAWAGKWDGRWQYEVRDGAFHHSQGEALVFAVRPVKVLAFTKGTFTQTQHRF